LCELGYAAESHGERGYFEATLKLVALGGHVVERTDVVRLAFPYIARLRNATGEAAHFSVPAEAGVLHLIQETGPSVVMVKPRWGELVPYHATASGKALLAYRADLYDRVLAQPLARFTAATITEPADLLLALAEVREAGYATDDQEFDLDLRCVAAPVFDHTGTVTACVGVSAPASRVGTEELPRLAAQAREVSSALSATLGFGARPKAASFLTSSSNPRAHG
jgi:DNA-binding IclR family transcriptional regulator